MTFHTISYIHTYIYIYMLQVDYEMVKEASGFTETDLKLEGES
jgi:hypothetical protein